MPSLNTSRAMAYGAVALAVTAVAGLASVSPAYAATSQVYVVHGIPDTPVDVYVNDKLTLEDFQPGDVAGPLTLPEGQYDIDLTKPNDPVSAAILSVDNATVPGGASISIAAHLDADGKPKVTPFVNDVSKLDPGQARLIVRHTAAAPAVDVRAGGTPVFSDLTNPNEAKADLPAGTVSADVVLAGTSTVAIPATDLNLAEGTATIVYAIGSATDKNLSVVAQVITGLHSAPGGVPSGDGGTAETGPGTVWLALIGVGGLLLLGGGARLAMTRRSAR